MLERAQQTSRSIGIGIGCTIAANFFFAFHDAAIKLLISDLAVWQILMVRSVVVVLGCVGFGPTAILSRARRSPVLRLMLLRSVLLLAAWLLYYSAARYLPLGQITTLYYSSPVMATVLALIVLRESVSIFRWIAVGLGFAGVIVTTNPADMTVEAPLLCALLASFLWAVSNILQRRMAHRERNLVQLFVSNLLFLMLVTPFAIQGWVAPSTGEFGLLLCVGILAGLAQFASFEGTRNAPVSALAPFSYTALAWAFLLGYLLWGEVPHRSAVAGAALITMAGLIALWGDRGLLRARH